MKREQFIAYFFIALLIFVVIEVIRIFSPFFDAIFWAAILTFAFYPLYTRLRSHLLGHETLAAVLMTFLIFLTVVPPLILVFVNLTTQAIDLYQLASNYIRDGRFEALVEQIRSWQIIEKIESNVMQWEPLKERTTEWILTSTKAIANFSVAQVGVITKNIFFVGLNMILAFVLVFIFLKDGQNIYEFIYQITPLTEKDKKAIFGQINETFAAVIRGQILTSLTQSAVAGLIFGLLGLPAPIFFAMVTFMSSLIPMFGTWAVWLPFVIYLVAAHEIAKAVILFVVGIGVISLIDNFMKPVLIGEKTKLPYFLLFFGIMGGLKLYGLMGIFLAPVILSLFFVVVKIYRESFH